MPKYTYVFQVFTWIGDSCMVHLDVLKIGLVSRGTKWHIMGRVIRFSWVPSKNRRVSACCISITLDSICDFSEWVRLPPIFACAKRKSNDLQICKGYNLQFE